MYGRAAGYILRREHALVLGLGSEFAIFALLDLLERLVVRELDPLKTEREQETDASETGARDREDSLCDNRQVQGQRVHEDNAELRRAEGREEKQTWVSPCAREMASRTGVPGA